MRRKSAGKTWRIVATFREYYGPPEETKERIRSHEFSIQARTLPDAFMTYNRRYRLDGLIGIGISEVRQDEEDTERKGRCAALS